MYIGHLKASRKLLNNYENEVFTALRKKTAEKSPSKPSSLLKQGRKKTAKKPAVPEINAECARLNLWPLITEGKEAHPALYEMACQLLRHFYGKNLLTHPSKAECRFLDQFLVEAKKAILKPTPFALEKVEMPSPELRTLYYHMLKGTKAEKEGPLAYPSLLDYIRVDPNEEKLCLAHAHPTLLSFLFPKKVAAALYEKIHQKKAPALTQELLEQIYNECHCIQPSQELYAFIQLPAKKHKRGPKRTLIAQDENTQLSLRKNVYLQSS